LNEVAADDDGENSNETGKPRVVELQESLNPAKSDYDNQTSSYF
jgi:hypothetical protein